MQMNKPHIKPIVTEKEIFEKGYKTILAIDEAGRGPLAGPLCVGGTLFQSIHIPLLKNRIFFDSKQLSEIKRNDLFSVIEKEKIPHKTIFISAHRIDTRGIQYAWEAGIKKLADHFQPDVVLIDGRWAFNFSFPHLFIVDGDNLLPSISAASIVAKVTRDAHMVALHKKYPQYDFQKHRGYGTKNHITLIKKHGLSPLHRKTYCKNFL